MRLLDLTTYDQVRAVLGVSDEELEDSTLNLPIYSQKLLMALEDIHPDLQAFYETTSSAIVKTHLEQKLLNVVQVFAAHATARTLLTSAALFAPKSITDGRAQFDRFQDPFALLRDDLDKALSSLKERLRATLIALGFIFPPLAGRTYFGVAPLASNPITNV